ncbi:MAG: hypothetical protein KIT44_03315 [Opitutaceae bacterium]|nr:hypothetical protein [Opitutaceae bacterium]
MKWLFITFLTAVCLVALAREERPDIEQYSATYGIGWVRAEADARFHPGCYVDAFLWNGGQSIRVREDGTFESHAAFEAHRKGVPAKWEEFSFSGHWQAKDGWITFTYTETEEYEGEKKTLTYDFLLGTLDGRPAMLFKRGNDKRCKFIYELFTLKEEAPNQQE